MDSKIHPVARVADNLLVIFINDAIVVEVFVFDIARLYSAKSLGGMSLYVGLILKKSLCYPTEAGVRRLAFPLPVGISVSWFIDF
ncbi:MAG: hypothetical protein IPK21_06985 [Haliscomenobacter sp.]|nr:hypothetical protein [Haliscomenobacter sp.]